ncbi:hypothetical protein PQX77_007587 [Marasmius sp. AFHP31]|nr:hypothetical protein PQX77_007587 [Marasmius sp. AFHP31]
MIQIANAYGVEKWLEPAYDALARRAEMVEEDEAEMIGMKGVLVIVKARETRLREEIRRAQDPIVDGFGSEGKEYSEEVDELVREQGDLALNSGGMSPSAVVLTGRASSRQDGRPGVPATPEDSKSDDSRTMAPQSDTYLQAPSHQEFDPSAGGEENREVEKNNQAEDRSCPLLPPLERQDLPSLQLNIDPRRWRALEDKLSREILCKVVLLSCRHVILNQRLAYNNFTNEIRKWECNPQTLKRAARRNRRQRLDQIETQLGTLDNEIRALIGDEDQYSSFGLTYSIYFLRMKRQGKIAFVGYSFLLFVIRYTCKELRKLIQIKKEADGML